MGSSAKQGWDQRMCAVSWNHLAWSWIKHEPIHLQEIVCCLPVASFLPEMHSAPWKARCCHANFLLQLNPNLQIYDTEMNWDFRAFLPQWFLRWWDWWDGSFHEFPVPKILWLMSDVFLVAVLFFSLFHRVLFLAHVQKIMVLGNSQVNQLWKLFMNLMPELPEKKKDPPRGMNSEGSNVPNKRNKNPKK